MADADSPGGGTGSLVEPVSSPSLGALSPAALREGHTKPPPPATHTQGCPLCPLLGSQGMSPKPLSS